MSNVVIKPMQWASVKDLHDCEPLSQADLACMKDVRAALARHGKLDRFALHLIHKHFEIAPDEVLVEYSDAHSREQFFRVEAADSATAKLAIPTTWTLDSIEPMARCVCAYRATHGHLGRHETGIEHESSQEPATA
jgi:hypothetical protein